MMNRPRGIRSVKKTVLVSFACAVLSSGAESVSNPPNTGMADPVALMNAFDRYLAGLPATGGLQVLVMPLVALRGLTSESMNASGKVTIDLNAGSVVSRVRGLPADGAFDLWLIKNRPAPGHTTMAEPQDQLVKVGAYQAQGAVQTLSAIAGRREFHDICAGPGVCRAV